ncbi:MAG TPA: hypothetical protein VN903_07235 [Polyangia bacterium]|jgi:hypothetical protein|nr:hypothetical protein [Polyangia bacterium]
MTDGANMPPICRQVWERALEGGAAGRDVMGDAELGAHVGSCMACFRTVAELREVPRLAAALRAGTPPADVPDRFWDDLAARTTDAASAALRQPARHGAARLAGFATLAAAVAAAVVLFAGRTGTVSHVTAPRSAVATASVDDDMSAEDAVDVADLDDSALRRLLDRLRERAPGKAAALAAVADVGDASDVVFDEDGQMNDELADLDGPALLRIERTLAGASL